MPGQVKIPQNLNYLANKPKRLKWKVIAGDGYSLDYYQSYDLIFDEYDLKIRKLDTKENLEQLKI